MALAEATEAEQVCHAELATAPAEWWRRSPPNLAVLIESLQRIGCDVFNARMRAIQTCLQAAPPVVGGALPSVIQVEAFQ